MKATQFDLEVNGTRLGGRSWLPDAQDTPDGRARAALVIVHGVAEHGGRYAAFATAAAEQGIAVFAVDHRGHGLTAGTVARAGHVADRGGWQLIVDDLRAVVRHVRFRHPDVPVVLLGHSMGSLVARELVTQPPLLVDGMVLIGPPGHPGAKAAGTVLASAIVRTRGAEHRSKLLDRLTFAGHNAAFSPARTDRDWLSGVPEQVDSYLADEWCGFVCSASFMRDLARAAVRVNSPENAASTPHDLPILLLAGSDDPVSNSGVAAQRAAVAYEAAGVKRVEVNIYPGGRHELLNDVMAAEVTHDILAFVDTLAFDDNPEPGTGTSTGTGTGTATD
ncbi:alpha/beta hydrolase [Aestuariimicrobium sp. T2.26MG-19.2B]|uniref:alpha/beta hydrolase n=1 Tax=Aestuariimicrobium sp. T2.26MG-19.2B TaxID=3040679 RepID=UPI00247786A7|nr:alpha/beta hydrolase [Aestuariimicrobium sp. T2.26MG-19.2B]CAI9400299.1 Monoacylglycerol lipase [Aestuariimicrobium sp. T2.26MG-19.2B]